MKFVPNTLLLCLIVVIFFQHDVHAQGELYDNSDYFHNLTQEKFFLHTNKTTYFTGEKVWWKAYVVKDFNNKPEKNTANLHVNFYNIQKELISHQLFFVDAGVSSGQLDLPTDLATGTYYMTIGTQWNKNFDNTYIAKLNVINPKENPTETNQQEVSESFGIKMMFYPESGTLLNNIDNTVFYSIQNDSSNQYIPSLEAVLVDNTTGQEISKFKSDAYGGGMIRFKYQEGHHYEAILTYNTKTYKFELPMAKSSGIVVHKEETAADENQQKFSIQLTADLAEANHDNTLFVTIHRNNRAIYLVPLKINRQYKKYLLPISKLDLFEGVNTITVFNEKNNPLAERHFYNRAKSAIQLSVSQTGMTKDSIKLDFQLKNTDSLTNISISVLPKETKLNDNAPNIVDAFMVDPYLKTTLQFGRQLDLLSQTDIDVFLQVHAKPTKKNDLKTNTPQYKLERGLTIKGVVNTSIDDIAAHRVVLSSVENDILLVTSLNADKSFEFSNLALKNKDNYRLGLLNKKGELIKAGFYVYKQNLSYKPDSDLLYEYGLNTVAETTKKEYVPSDLITFKDVEKLDEVVLYGKNEKEEPEKSLYPNGTKELGSGFTKTLKIDELQGQSLTLIEFLNNQSGVKASDNYKPDPDDPPNMHFISVVVGQQGDTFFGTSEALILIDNQPVDNESLHNVRLSQIESVKINKSGAGYGMRGANGVVLIETKKGTNVKQETVQDQNYYSGEIEFGFSTPLPVFQPSILEFNTMSSRAYYETLDWIPSLILSKGLTYNLEVFKGSHESIRLFINGINSDGQLLYKVVDVIVE